VLVTVGNLSFPIAVLAGVIEQEPFEQPAGDPTDEGATAALPPLR
jgi:hypothetical protein